MIIKEPVDSSYGNSKSVEPQVSASVLCLRRVKQSFEILFVQRPKTSRVAPEYYVFPGGKIDPEDASDSALSRLSNTSPTCCSTDVTYPIALAACRELYEEVGILVTQDETESVDSLATMISLETFYTDLIKAQIKLDISKLHYWLRWITPKPMPVRFDTYFFVLQVPEQLQVFPHPDEIENICWMHPQEALMAYTEGQMPMLFPTVRNLEQLASLECIDDVITFVREFPKLTIEPTLYRDKTGELELEMPTNWPIC
ncbi:acyl-coenzyme A diphosphatase NUDT19-like [Ylistrum balloti]|uniref:acyl-coenzyme A diphosphatase NUDT19-like n=1 Tax=Ylistrum balloti TaxID=509963 RepID=UPI002905DBDB|nr:acyl-coenzyme A diphosphatase NUDT19-like [Ylistrum balloti]